MADTTYSAALPAQDGASLRAWVSVFGCMVGALIAVLDIQITNSSLPEIEGGIGTGSDNGTWISTSYLIGEIIMIPLTDYLSRVFTFRRFLIGNVILFLAFSIACAFAQNLGQMILLRGLQGFSGGVMIPMAFTRVLRTLPPRQQCDQQIGRARATACRYGNRLVAARLDISAVMRELHANCRVSEHLYRETRCPHRRFPDNWHLRPLRRGPGRRIRLPSQRSSCRRRTTIRKAGPVICCRIDWSLGNPKRSNDAARRGRRQGASCGHRRLIRRRHHQQGPEQHHPHLECRRGIAVRILSAGGNRSSDPHPDPGASLG
jgi:hypothetical protein